MKTLLKAVGISLGVLFTASAALAEQTKKFIEGVDYRLLPEPVNVQLKEDQTAVVQEFFVYTCGHCNNFHPIISKWKKSIADDVIFEMLPVWNDDPYAKAFWAAKYLNLDEKFHDDVFNNIHVKGNRMSTMEDFTTLAATYDADEKKFESTAESFPVGGQISKANRTFAELGKTFGGVGTPAVLVNGKYLVQGKHAETAQKTYNNLLETVDYLIDLERSNKDL